MTDTLTTLSDRLRKKQSLDAALPRAQRLAAVASVLRQAGAAIDPRRRSGRPALDALGVLERLAGLADGELQRIFLALRALDLRPGELIGGDLAGDEIAQIMIDAAGCVATLDDDDKVSGVLGEIGRRDPATLAARGRIARPAPFNVRDAREDLFNAPSGGADPVALLRAVDGLKTRRELASAPTSGAAPVDYRYVEDQERRERAGDDLFQTWMPTLEIAEARQHPSGLVESAALASTPRPIPSYRPTLSTRTIARGQLSDMQLEEIVYAGEAHQRYLPADPMDPNAPPPRQGYLLGAGTGSGKGRICCGVILDNWNQGRRKAVYISERQRLFADLRRDWIALGGRAGDLIELSEFRPDQTLPERDGVLFLTWALLRSEDRLEQVVSWLGMASDGVVVGDEAHNCRNAVTEKEGFFENKRSLQGKAFLSLQQQLPNARVVYASATSASDIVSMGYAVRLGLWGAGTAFPTHESFFRQMAKGGVNALELVARDLKAMGLYSAPNLSFEGVSYERLEHQLTDAERRVQDELADAWAQVNVALQRAMISTGLKVQKGTAGGKQVVAAYKKAEGAGKKARALASSQFGMAKARFFQAFLSSVLAKPTIEAIKADLAAGKAPVVQMTNTYAANAERAIEENDTGDVADVEATPRDILIGYIEQQFPVVKHKVVERIVQGKKIYTLEAMVDASGDPVICSKAAAERDRLIAHVKTLSIPEGPLEQILEAFGTDAVAEVTGRPRRLVPGPDGKRILEDRTPAEVDEDIRLFQTGGKQILVFSSSGAAGSSYHADPMMGNVDVRRHYILQAGWRADTALQSAGRSHRAAQACPPEYVLVHCDLWSNRRMISQVASGMQKLGAITRGQRHAASEELFTQDDNLETDLAQEAWQLFLRDLEADRVANLSLAQFEHETGLPLRKPGTQALSKNLPPLRRFLNAMSGMTCARQEAFGHAFKQRLEEVKLQAISQDAYDRGIETIRPDSLVKLEETVVYRCPKTGARTRLIQMLRCDELDPVDFQEAQRIAHGKGNARFVKSALTERVALLAFPRLQGKEPRDDDKVLYVSPTGQRTKARAEIRAERWQPINPHEACDLWAAETQLSPGEDESVFYVVAGLLLPLWDKLPSERVTVYQMVTDEGDRILGRTISENWAQQFVARVNAASGAGLDPADTLRALERGEIATLANGWVVEGPRDPDGPNPEIKLIIDRDAASYRGELEADGLIARDYGGEIDDAVDYQLPRDRKARSDAWASLTRRKPVVGCTAIHA